MGHRFSKTLTNSTQQYQEQQQFDQSVVTTSAIRQNFDENNHQPTTINLLTTTAPSINQNLQFIQSTSNSISNNNNTNNQSARRFIIKIQLTKMESDRSTENNIENNTENCNNNNNNSKDNSIINNNSNNNLNIIRQQQQQQRPQILNLTFTKNISCDLMKTDNSNKNEINNSNSSNGQNSNNFNETDSSSTTTTTTSTNTIFEKENIKLNNLNLDKLNNRNAGSPVMVNNNFVSNFSTAPFIDDDGNNDSNLIKHCENSISSINNKDENNLNITVHRLKDCDILENRINSINNISKINVNNNNGADYQDVPDINQRVSSDITANNIDCHQNSTKIKENNSATTTMCANNLHDQKSHCCRRKTITTSSSSAYPSKWRCCKCACRDAVKKIVNSSNNSQSSSSSNCQNTIDTKNSGSSTGSVKSSNSWTSRFSCSIKKDNNQTKLISNNDDNSNNLVTTGQKANATTSSSSSSQQNSLSQNQQQQHNSINSIDASALVPATTNHLAIWSQNEVVFPIAARPGEILVLQCPQSLVCRIEDLDERARRLRAIEIETGIDTLSQAELDAALSAPWHPIICSPSNGLTFTAPGGTVVHSRVDYIHCLVPDLEKITSSSFYWGKMDRYEAERLLEGKPEGTFLLRDSAQEEYLFSVTFRKYGRSLHARIEQFNHKFSFDCHDPGVFTAPTVTRLLEHYKDPSCVMFFEPMLTIPLNRNFSFSLQQLCRATIVSNISYDGINELQLPNSLKGYLKEYHYKLRVRVKPYDEPFYSCS